MSDSKVSLHLTVLAPNGHFTAEKLAATMALLADHPATSTRNPQTSEETLAAARKIENMGFGGGPVVKWIWEPTANPMKPGQAVNWAGFGESMVLYDNQSHVRGKIHGLPYRNGLDCRRFFIGREGTNHYGALPPEPATKQMVFDRFLEILNLYEPEFGFIDDWGKQIHKRRHDDPRKYAWSVMVFGPRLVKQVGKVKLLALPAFAVKETKWGGVLVQTGQDAMQPTTAERRKVTTALQELFQAK